MTETSRWQLMEQLFNACVHLPAREKFQQLSVLCHDDALLHQEVKELLLQDQKYHEHSLSLHKHSDPLCQLIESTAQKLIAEEDALASTILGNWRIEELIGEGGMSYVYFASRDDQQFTKKVAVKILKKGMEADLTKELFLRERQILAQLEHPNIARLIDAGTTDNERPYFVMELVEGMAIDKYCQQKHLETQEILSLFLQICSAVAYAHRNLIIHQDIKPGNILITDEGIPKLLDFGISHFAPNPKTTPKGSTKRSKLSSFTPAFASPEQINQQNITTASDIYSLGLLLCKLLCGQLPNISTATNASANNNSHLKNNSHLNNNNISADLSVIINHALSYEPTERYSSVEQFAMDIEKYQGHFPLMAHTKSFYYTGKLFIRRNRLLVSLATISSLILIIFTMALLFQSGRLKEEQLASYKRLQTTESVKEFMVELFPLPETRSDNKQLTSLELLQQGYIKANALSSEPPEQKAALLETIGRIYQRMGYYKNAIPLFKEALALHKSSNKKPASELANNISRLAILTAEQGDYIGAQQLFREALSIRQEIYGLNHRLVAKTISHLALSLHDIGDYKSAKDLYLQSIAISKQLKKPDIERIIVSNSNLALLLYDIGVYTEAKSLITDNLQKLKVQFANENEMLAYNFTLLGMIQTARKKFHEAETAFQEAKYYYQKKLGIKHPESARLLAAYAELHKAKGDWSTAHAIHLEVLNIRRSKLGENHPELAMSLSSLAELLFIQGTFTEAESLWRQALNIYRHTIPTDHPNVAQPLTGLAKLQINNNNCQKAESILEKVLAILTKYQSDTHPQLQSARQLMKQCSL